MPKRKVKKLLLGILSVVLILTVAVSATKAENAEEERYYIDAETVDSGLDTGYSESHQIDKENWHYGWSIGEFSTTGYSRVTYDDEGNPIFLKTLGDKVTLWFMLEQNIDCLNGNERLSISNDKNGYDLSFATEQGNFGRGTLIVRHTDYQNKKGDPVIYVDYLSAVAIQDANVEIQLLEEGDYEVALDYQIKKSKKHWYNKDKYKNYRIYFKFSVRNGNCMVFPFDVSTKSELLNCDFTENGFYLDLAKSRYLTIDIKKEVMNEGRDGLVEDVRFNKPAMDGEEFVDEGIYTITVSNQYTGEETVKKIYVGDDDVLKAYVTTDLSIEDINALVENGATINEDGTISNIPEPEEATTETVTEEYNDESESNNAELATETDAKVDDLDSDEFNIKDYIVQHKNECIIVGSTLLALILVLVLAKKKKRKIDTSEADMDEGDEE